MITIDRSKVIFKEIPIRKNLVLYLTETPANHRESMEMLKEKGLRPLTYGEAVFLMLNREIKDTLKGNWFWLAGAGHGAADHHLMLSNDGILGGGVSNKEKTLHVHGGHCPLCLKVNDYVAQGSSRFEMFADVPPETIAPVVLGLDAYVRVARGVPLRK